MSTTRAAKLRGCANVPLRMLSQIGLWGNARSWLRRCAPSLALAQATYGLVAQVINVALTWGNLAQTAEFLVALLQMSMTCVKIRGLLSNAVPIQEAVTTLDQMHDAHTQTGDVTHILQRTRKASDMYSHFAHTGCVSALFIFICIGVFVGFFKREIPFRLWYPYIAKISPMFELSLLSLGPLAFFDLYVILLYDMLFNCVLIEVIGEFQVLQHRLTHVDRYNTFGQRSRAKFKKLDKAALKRQQQPDNVNDRRANVLENLAAAAPSCNIRTENSLPSPAHAETSAQRLAACVVHHQALIRLVSKLETMFQPALVIHLVCNFLVGLSLAYVTLKSDKVDLQMINMLAMGIVCVGEFASYCYFCNQVTTESTLVGEALYACAWWDADAGFKSSLRIVQLRTNQPLFIRAAAIFPLSMETFTKVMNTAYNLYNMMISTN